ncbi:MAG: DUF3500 domain-containing protein [Chitinophagaceae bacterium]|nr:DUF3500 domain-containing protein [Chitinophagaceae bacterium]
MKNYTKQKRWVIAVCAISFIVCSAFYGIPGYLKYRSSKKMTEAAKGFIASLAEDQKPRTIGNFDDRLRDDWEFYPRARKGLSLKDMTLEQRRAAHTLLQSGLSSYGYLKVNTIMGMEPVLKAIEAREGIRQNVVRDEELYFIAIFGTPGTKEPWGWRIEGHHVSVHFTIADGEIIANTPLGFGSSPAEVREGTKAGFRPFAGEEDKARELLLTLNAKQKAIAIFDSLKTPGDLLTMSKIKVEPLKPVGINYNALNAEQKELLMILIDEYLNRMPEDIAKARREKLVKEGYANLYFGWAGGEKFKDAHYYRIQGKSFIIEYDNSQTNANHVHSVWRDFEEDFGHDWLHKHLKNAPHSHGH